MYGKNSIYSDSKGLGMRASGYQQPNKGHRGHTVFKRGNIQSTEDGALIPYKDGFRVHGSFDVIYAERG